MTTLLLGPCPLAMTGQLLALSVRMPSQTTPLQIRVHTNKCGLVQYFHISLFYSALVIYHNPSHVAFEKLHLKEVIILSGYLIREEGFLPGYIYWYFKSVCTWKSTSIQLVQFSRLPQPSQCCKRWLKKGVAIRERREVVLEENGSE